MDESVNNKLNLFRDFTRHTRLAFLEMAELDSEYVLEQWYLCKHVGSLCIAPQHINWRVPSATHVACLPVAYISSTIYRFLFLFFHFSNIAFGFQQPYR